MTFFKQNNDSTENYSYFPVIFESEGQLKKIEKALNVKEIFFLEDIFTLH